MTPLIQILLSSLLGSTLLQLAISCRGRDKPLLLSSYLDRNEAEKARSLSKVDATCLKDFVPNSYTGFLTVDKMLGNHLFFWFFPSTENERAPLLLWLNGGPALSSMIGLFGEHGPMVVITGKTRRGGSKEKQEENVGGYRKRKYPWTGPFSMLYVDNPAGVGFSFSDSGEKGHRFTSDGYTKDLVSFMNQFLKLFPEFKTREIYLGGQSYAGRYIPSLAYAIHKQIEKGKASMNLAGIYLGSPFFDPEIQLKFSYEYLYTMGSISHKSLSIAKNKIKEFYAKSKTGTLTEAEIEAFFLQPRINISSEDFIHNYVTRQTAPYKEVASLMTDSNMRRAANLGDREYYGWEDHNKLYSKFANDAFLVPRKQELAELMNNYKVLIYNGDYDVIINNPSIEAALMTAPWNFQHEYNSTIRTRWLRDEAVIGYYSLTDKFCRVVIHGAGHQVPMEKPEIALSMMKQFISNGCVQDPPKESSDNDRRSSSSLSLWHSTSPLFILVLGQLMITYALANADLQT